MSSNAVSSDYGRKKNIVKKKVKNITAFTCYQFFYEYDFVYDLFHDVLYK